jgi:VanZ family protein
VAGIDRDSGAQACRGSENLPSHAASPAFRGAGTPTIRVIDMAPASNAPVPAAPPAARRDSPLARTALVVYLVLLVYGSLSPWVGWRSLGVSPFAFLGAPWPLYVTGFDLALNVLAYVPLGFLLVLALHRRVRGLPAVVLATAAAAFLSVLVEAVQNYLPARIASNLDALTNVIGAALGALAATALAPALIDGRRLQQARRRWFRPHAAALLLLAAIWPLAQIHPGPMLFGNGELGRGWLAAALGVFDLALPDFDASQFAAAEALVTACGMLAAGATLTAAMKQRAPRLRILLLLLGVALATKAITYGHQFGPERMLAWLTPGAVAGLAVGWLAVTAAATTVAARSAKALAAAALALLVVVVNVVPSNPYHAHWLAGWQPGRLRDVAASSDWLAQAWPYAALAVLLWSLARRRPSPRRAADAS